MPKLVLPSQLAKVAGNIAEHTLNGSSLTQIFTSITSTYPYLQQYLLTEDKQFTDFINVYVNEKHVNSPSDPLPPLLETDVIEIVANFAGG